MRELFTIDVILDGTEEIHSTQGQVNMVRFHGRCDCDFFHGEILPGGVDTQRYLTGQPAVLSARYALAGTDSTGAPARLFIENNGVTGQDGVCRTTPVILTDSPALAWLEQARLTGRITGTERGVMIHFYSEEEA